MGGGPLVLFYVGIEILIQDTFFADGQIKLLYILGTFLKIVISVSIRHIYWSIKPASILYVYSVVITGVPPTK